MLHLTVVKGEGLTPDVDYVLRSEERIRIGIANDKSKMSLILDFSPAGEIEIKLDENFLSTKTAPQEIFFGKIKEFIDSLNAMSNI